MSAHGDLNTYKREIRSNRMIIVLLVIPVLLFIFISIFKYLAFSTTEYYTNMSIAKQLGVARFICIVLAVGACLYLWRNSSQQFWYGLVEIFSSLLYTFLYLDETSFLPFVNWLTALYFAVRGFQNCSDGIKKDFRFKRKLLTILVITNAFNDEVFRFIRGK